MNQRQKKKQIPKNTDYCYTITERNHDGTLTTKRCPHYKTIGYQDDVLYDAKVSSEEDVLLSERIKTCGERLSVYNF